MWKYCYSNLNDTYQLKIIDSYGVEIQRVDFSKQYPIIAPYSNISFTLSRDNLISFQNTSATLTIEALVDSEIYQNYTGKVFIPKTHFSFIQGSNCTYQNLNSSHHMLTYPLTSSNKTVCSLSNATNPSTCSVNSSIDVSY